MGRGQAAGAAILIHRAAQHHDAAAGGGCAICCHRPLRPAWIVQMLQVQNQMPGLSLPCLN